MEAPRRAARSRSSPPIPRTVNRASPWAVFRAQDAPIEPSGRQWTRGAGHCTPDVNLDGEDRKSATAPRGVWRGLLMPSWTKSRASSLAARLSTCSLSSCKTGVTLRLACSVQTIDKRTEARPALPPRRSEAASARMATIGSRDISDQGVHSAAERSNRCTSAAVVTPLLQETPPPRPRHA